MNGKDYALLVGIDTYPKKSGLRALSGAQADIAAFEAWLKSPENPNSANTKITTIYPPPDVAQRKIYDALSELLDEVKAAGGERPYARRLYLYFAGHGSLPPYSGAMSRLEAAYFPSDWTSKLSGAYVPLTEVTFSISARFYFEEVLLVVDACREEPDEQVNPQSSPLQPDLDPGGATKFDLDCLGRECAAGRPRARPRRGNAWYFFTGADGWVEIRQARTQRPLDRCPQELPLPARSGVEGPG